MPSLRVKKPKETSPTSLSEQPANIKRIPAAIKAFFIRSPLVCIVLFSMKIIESSRISVELFANFLKDVVG